MSRVYRWVFSGSSYSSVILSVLFGWAVLLSNNQVDAFAERMSIFRRHPTGRSFLADVMSSHRLCRHDRPIFSSHSNDNDHTDHPGVSSFSSSSNSEPTMNARGGGIVYRGKGAQAVVRPGSILVAPMYEFHHFYRQAAIFIYGMGYEDEDPNTTNKEKYIIRGVILDHPTPFTVGEMLAKSETDNDTNENPLYQNLIYRGGDKGGDGIMILHAHKEFGETVRDHDDDDDSMATVSFSHGGWDAALQYAATKGTADVGDEFKFFFNFCEFTEEELEQMLDEEEDGDGWMSVEAYDPELVLSSEWDRGELWKRLRNTITQLQ